MGIQSCFLLLIIIIIIIIIILQDFNLFFLAYTARRESFWQVFNPRMLRVVALTPQCNPVLIVSQMVNSCYGRYQIYLYYFPGCQESKSPCIISMYNGGLKASIRLSGRGRSCLAEMLNLGCLGQAWHRERIFLPIQSSLSF